MKLLDTRHCDIDHHEYELSCQRGDGGASNTELLQYVAKTVVELIEEHRIAKPRLLDLGCGNGTFGLVFGRLFSSGYAMFGLDIAFSELQRSELSKAGYSSLIEGNFLSLGPNRKFDIIVANHVLEHIAPEHLTMWLDKIREASAFSIVSSPIPMYTFAWSPFYLKASLKEVSDIDQDVLLRIYGAIHKSIITEDLLKRFGYARCRDGRRPVEIYFSHIYVAENIHSTLLSNAERSSVVKWDASRCLLEQRESYRKAEELLLRKYRTGPGIQRPVLRYIYELELARAIANEPRIYRISRRIVNILVALLELVQHFRRILSRGTRMVKRIASIVRQQI